MQGGNVKVYPIKPRSISQYTNRHFSVLSSVLAHEWAQPRWPRESCPLWCTKPARGCSLHTMKLSTSPKEPPDKVVCSRVLWGALRCRPSVAVYTRCSNPTQSPVGLSTAWFGETHARKRLYEVGRCSSPSTQRELNTAVSGTPGESCMWPDLLLTEIWLVVPLGYCMQLQPILGNWILVR